ncbi:hypothetical protein HDV00_006366 [Rhizophlyctis rosea]|nr:hypothetical protein HDV00_006366 [Rhizophlyctis rosea]
MLLTGESLPVRKTTNPIIPTSTLPTFPTVDTNDSSLTIAPTTTDPSYLFAHEPLTRFDTTRSTDTYTGDGAPPIGDRTNLAYSSTVVTKGRGKGIVYATGRVTQVGKIADLLSGKTRPTTPTDEEKSCISSHPDPDVGTPHWRERVAKSESVKRFLKLIGWGVKGDGKTPLQHSLDRMMLFLLVCAFLLAVIVFGAFKFDFGEIVALYAMSVAIAIVPEGLPAVLTVTLAIGVKSMAQHKALVRQLASIEALGMVTNICSDKTGTLTEGRMSAKAFWVAGTRFKVDGTGLDPTQGSVLKEVNGNGELEVTEEMVREDDVLFEFATCNALCNNSVLHPPHDDEPSYKAVGDPTEIALQVLAHRLHYVRARELPTQGLKFVAEQPFDPSIKRMTSVYRERKAKDGEGSVELKFYMKGAVESVLAVCDGYYAGGGEIVSGVDEAFRTHTLQEMTTLASQGLRVLALAHRTELAPNSSVSDSRPEVERNMTFLGLVGMYDPPRPESASSVATCRDAGIVVHMATGDHVDTARAIAKQIGILRPGDPDTLVCAASEFDSMTERQVDAMELPLVLARCSPETKVKFIQALHRRGKFVAMTGDGTNDAPAIKLSDVGIAMGQNGSDVAKEASAIVLTDDNFASIVAAVREGRRLFANIVKFAMSFLGANVAEIVVLVFGLAVRSTDNEAIFPMAPIQILWLNMITSSPIALAIAYEPGDPDLMRQPPRGTTGLNSPQKKRHRFLPTSSLFTTEFILDALVYGITMGLCSLASFILTLALSPNGFAVPAAECNHEGASHVSEGCEGVYRARGVVFVGMSLLLLIYGYNCKDLRQSNFRVNFWGNKALLGAIVGGAVLVVPTVYIPVVNYRVFKQLQFGWEWGLIVASWVVFLGVAELWKLTKRRWFRARERREGVQRDMEEIRVG